MDARMQATTHQKEKNTQEIASFGDFNPKKKEHVAYIQKQTALFCEYDRAIKQYDVYTLIPLALSLLLYASSLFSGLALLCLCLASGFFAVRLQQRNTLDVPHLNQLDKMIKIYHWCMQCEHIAHMPEYDVIIDVLKAIYEDTPIDLLTQHLPTLGYDAFSKAFIETFMQTPHAISPQCWKIHDKSLSKEMISYAKDKVASVCGRQPEEREVIALPHAMPSTDKWRTLCSDMRLAMVRFNYGPREEKPAANWLDFSFFKRQTEKWFDKAKQATVQEVVKIKIN